MSSSIRYSEIDPTGVPYNQFPDEADAPEPAPEPDASAVAGRIAELQDLNRKLDQIAKQTAELRMIREKLTEQLKRDLQAVGRLIDRNQTTL